LLIKDAIKKVEVKIPEIQESIVGIKS